ncbi:MAG: alkaline phytoceramidase [Woeseiaceae bacterium]|nr:alkaline phytoceramidase [Woeseiaceae bacterium]
MSYNSRTIGAVTVGITLLVFLFALTSPIPQDPAYHVFADSRQLLSIANFWNVISNLPFLLAGAWGLSITVRLDQRYRETRAIYGVFFVGVALTAFGSAYYHLYPANLPLVWDRLPMTIAIAGIFAIAINEYHSPALARRLLVPLLVIGIASVIYWHITEIRNIGDLRPYAIVQFLPILAVLAMLVRRGFKSDMTPSLWYMVGFYVAAKVFEHFDAEIYSALAISGHTLKHVFAALGPAAVAAALRRRL